MKTALQDSLVKSRILVVDEQPLLREGIVHFINRQDDLVVCGEADSISSAKTAVLHHIPDLLLLDFQLGSGDTIAFIKALKSERPAMGILVFSQCDETLFAEKALRAGAQGYVLKKETPQEVLVAIQTVLHGGMYVSRQIAVLILQKFFEKPMHRATGGGLAVEKLSDRELHIFQRIGAGLRSRQIASELKLSIKTIETHRENMKHKLGLSKGAELARCAAEWVSENFLPGSKADVEMTPFE